jgi:hypothetical protein
VGLTNMTDAVLLDVNFDGAYTSGDTWSNTMCPDGTNSSSYSPQTCEGHGM